MTHDIITEHIKNEPSGLILYYHIPVYKFFPSSEVWDKDVTLKLCNKRRILYILL